MRAICSTDTVMLAGSLRSSFNGPARDIRRRSHERCRVRPLPPHCHLSAWEAGEQAPTRNLSRRTGQQQSVRRKVPNAGESLSSRRWDSGSRATSLALVGERAIDGGIEKKYPTATNNIYKSCTSFLDSYDDAALYTSVNLPALHPSSA